MNNENYEKDIDQQLKCMSVTEEEKQEDNEEEKLKKEQDSLSFKEQIEKKRKFLKSRN